MIFKEQKISWEFECCGINRKVMMMGKITNSIANSLAISGQYPVIY